MNASLNQPEDLYDILAPFIKAGYGNDGQVVAIVGGGGKTATMFALAAATRARGLKVAITTTTHIRDPRQETGRYYDHLVFLDEIQIGEPQRFHPSGITVIAAGALETEGRLRGVEAAWVGVMRHHYDLILVEADGSRGLPVKAPAAHEPVMPPDADLLIGVVGLDCLGRPMDDATVHRPGLFGPLCGCLPGEAIHTSHIVPLCQAKEGLFRNCPPEAARILLLNKADILSTGTGLREARIEPARLYRELQALRDSLDGYLVCSLEPGFRVLHQWLR